MRCIFVAANKKNMYHQTTSTKVAEATAAMFVANGHSLSIFMEGVPGSGKTAFAKHLSREYEWRLFRYDCNAESNSGLIVSFDLEGIVTGQSAYIKGPLWSAFDHSHPSVILIDEVDKSPRDFEAFLLRVTDELSFSSPKHEEVRAKAPVVFVFTSNGRREMSPEFLRRCMRIKVEYPELQQLMDIVAQEVPFGLSVDLTIEKLCVFAKDLQKHIEPDQMPSAKEIAFCTTSLSVAESKSEVASIIEAFMLKGLSVRQANDYVKYDIVKKIAR